MHVCMSSWMWLDVEGECWARTGRSDWNRWDAGSFELFLGFVLFYELELFKPDVDFPRSCLCWEKAALLWGLIC